MSRRNLLLTVGAAAVIILAWFVFLWSPKGDDLEQARERRSVAEARESELEVRLAQLRDAERRAPELEAAGDRLRAAVPPTAELSTFLLAANQAATDAGVDFLSIAPTAPSQSTVPGGPTEVPLSINVTGGYHQVLDYLDRLLALPRVVVVDTLSATTGGDTDDLSVSLTGRMFTTELPAGAASTAQAASTSAPSTTATTVATNTIEAG